MRVATVGNDHDFFQSNFQYEPSHCGLCLTIVKIKNDVRFFKFTSHEVSVQYIYFLFLFVKMSEQVTLATVRELLETQERTFKYTTELLTKNFKDDINVIKRTFDEPKTSLNFSQKDIDDIKSMIY